MIVQKKEIQRRNQIESPYVLQSMKLATLKWCVDRGCRMQHCHCGNS